MKAIWFIALFLMPVLAQTQDGCDYEPSRKVEKLLEKANDKRKYQSEERREFLIEAVEEDEGCLECRLMLGELEFLIAKIKNRSFDKAKNAYEQLIERCPNYHSEPYYYLGAINYAMRNYDEAVEYFDYFLKFPEDGEEKFARDYDRKYKEVMESLPNVKFYRDFYKNEYDIEPQRVEGVSSQGDDYLPMLSPDNELIFFTRVQNKKAKGDLYSRRVEEFTLSERENINTNFSDGEPLPRPFNLGDNYGGATISVDNKEMFVAKKNPVKDNPQNIDLYVTSYERYQDKKGDYHYKWDELQNLGSNINGDMSWEAQPSLSADGNTLYFATVREECKRKPDGDPSTDIFYSERQEDGTWGKAKPLSETINTSGDDKAPFMHSDSKTLYFASNGHRGIGGYDLFFSKQKEDGSWTEPENLGHPINTPEDEHGMIVSSDGELAYFATRNISGSRGFDIYSFQLPKELRPERVVILKGEITNEDGSPKQDATVELTYAQSKKVEEIEVSNDDGKYAAVVNVEKGEDVLMSVKDKGLAFNSRVVINKDKEKDEQPSVVKLSVKTEEEKKGKPFRINDITYATNSAEIDRVSKVILDEFAEYLKENPNIDVEIRGHTDNVGSDKDNLALSMDRAFEVKGYLEQQGIDGRRVTAKGYGESDPVESNETAEGRAQNRRTEFVIK
ncbi:OmpA family protein [Halocola ammonii]